MSQSLTMPTLIWLRKNKLLLFTVIIPTLIAIIYFGFIASDVYVSESKFVVRSPQKQSASGLGVLLQTAGFTKAQDDVYAVHDYIMSRDAMNALDQKFKLKEMYSSKQIDVFGRFGVFGLDLSNESLYKFYQKKVNVDLDASSSISKLEVSAYTAQDALKLNEQLIEMSESLVNKMNDRGRGDQVSSAMREVDSAKKVANLAAQSLSSYRNSKNVFDTDKQSALQLQQIAKLQDSLSQVQSQLNQVRMLAPKNPQIPVLENQRATLISEISKQNSGVTGGDASLSTKSAEYERLLFDNEFAQKQLAAALSSLELAKNDAQRKQLYVERIVQPNLPDKAIEPKRIRSILAIFALGLVVFAIMSMLLAGIKEHHN